MWKGYNFSVCSCLYRNVAGCILVWFSWTLIQPFLIACTDNVSLQLAGTTGSLEYLKEFHQILKMQAVGSNFSWHMKKPILLLWCYEWCTTLLTRGITVDEILIDCFLDIRRQFCKRLNALHHNGGWQLLLTLLKYHLRTERTEIPLPANTNLDQKK